MIAIIIRMIMMLKIAKILMIIVIVILGHGRWLDETTEQSVDNTENRTKIIIITRIQKELSL